VSKLREQGAWAVADQVLSSGTNFVPALLLARVLGPADYGSFSLAFLAWFSTLALLTAALMQPYTIAASALEGAEWRDVTRRASGAVVMAATVIGVIFATVGVAVGASTSLGQALLVLALLAPGLALQEFWRVASFAAARARTATANDGVWVLGQVCAFAVLLARGDATVAGCLFAWGIGAIGAAMVGVFQLGVVPTVSRSALRWAREWASLGAWFTVVTTIFTVGSLAVAVIIAAQTGNAGLGRFRAVQNLFGPIQLITIGAESVFLPHLVRSIRANQHTVFRESRYYSLLMAGAVAAYGLAVLVGAHLLLTKVFGPGFAPASVLVLPTMIAFVLDAAVSGASLQLRARAMGGRLVISQLAATVTRVGAVALLAGVGGLRAATWGLVIGSGVGFVVFWLQISLVRTQQRHTSAERARPARDLPFAEAG
jgi:O-antigen/teichoic acid export membrane protein